VYEGDPSGQTNVFRTPEGKPIIITQAGSNADKFGVLDIFFDKQGVIATDKSGEIKGSNELLDSQDFDINPKIDKLVKALIYDAFKDTAEIGIINETIRPITTRNRENTLVSAMLDGFIEMASKNGTEEIKDLDFAMMHSSAIKGNLQKGVLNEGQLSLAFSFVRPFYNVKASEKQIVDTINYMLIKGNLIGKNDIPQFSSKIKYEITETSHRNGKKTLDLSKLLINGEEVNINKPDDKKKYNMAIDELYTDTNYFGEAFNPPRGQLAQTCNDKSDKPLDIVKGLTDYLKNHHVNRETGELTFDVEPKNITVISKEQTSAEPSFSGKKLSYVA
jgi:2',3'-cyclic-nucleotide 2'-phosphodiesterase (5'-nucleotidase family)